MSPTDFAEQMTDPWTLARVYKLARLLVRDDASALDLIHQAILRGMLFLRNHPDDPLEDPAAFALRLIRWTAFDRYRKEARRQARARMTALGEEPRPDDRAADPAALAEAADELRKLDDAVRACLTPREREILRMRYEDGLSGEEIALRLGLSEVNVRSIASRARGKVRRYFDRPAGREFSPPPATDRPRAST